MTKNLSLGRPFCAIANALILCLIVPPVSNFTAVRATESGKPPQLKDTKKESKPGILSWDPPNVDAHLPKDAASECALSSVLEQAGLRAHELVINLQNYTAEERIDFRALGNAYYLDSDAGTFNYTAAIGRTGSGYVVQEDRRPEQGSHAFAAATKDVGLPQMALIFLPSFQSTYEMKCEGATEWSGQAVWVVHFRQRTGQSSQKVSLSFGGYPAFLKGRAWIAQDSGEVMHMEIGLMREVPEVGVKEWFLSVDYGPVRFQTKDVQVWLPQSADAYEGSEVRRTIVTHKFSNFLLFSVKTDEVIGSPTKPLK